MSYSTLLVERQGSVTVIRINRPGALNALNEQVTLDLAAAFQTYESDSDQRCAILTGTDKAFAAGADIKEMQGKGFSQMYGAEYFGAISAVTRIRKPWIAAVAGYALGGGCELAMMADLIIAADTAQFGQPEVKIGVIPGMGGTQRLARAVGKAKAMDMCLTGRTIGVEEAERLGLISRIVPADRLEEETLQIAAKIARMAPLAAIANKEAVNFAFESHLQAGLQFEKRLFHAIFATDDKHEGMTAFAEKRPPLWQGA